jgi:hypothetical protein
MIDCANIKVHVPQLHLELNIARPLPQGLHNIPANIQSNLAPSHIKAQLLLTLLQRILMNPTIEVPLDGVSQVGKSLS